MQPQFVWQAQFSQRLWVVRIAFFMAFSCSRHAVLRAVTGGNAAPAGALHLP